MKITKTLLIPLVLSSPAFAEVVLQLDEIEVKADSKGSYTSKAVQVGTFRDMDPVDVPLTTNVVTREVLDAQATNTIFGALRNTAGVTRSQLNGSTYDNISIRGILVENRGNYRLNGSLPIINLIDIPLENKERVEVLKGASSLYYGFVPPSGIVNMVTKRAGPEEVKSLTFSANEFGAMAAHVDYGKRFGERQEFGARINIVGGKEDIGIDNFSGHRALEAAALDWRATDNLSFKLDIEHYRKDVSEQAAIALPTAGGRAFVPKTPPAERNHAGEWQKYDAEATNVLFRTDYAINDNWSFLFEAGRAKTERDRRFSQFKFSNLTTGAGNLQISFTEGQEFTNDNVRTEFFGRVPMGDNITNELSIGFTANKRNSDAPTFNSVSVAQNYYDPVEIAKVGTTSAGYSDVTIYDRGFYVFDRILIGDRWQAMIGARAGNYDSQSTVYRSATNTTTRSDFSASGEISPSVSVLYKLMPRLSVYASYVESLEETEQPGITNANFGSTLDPADSEQHEIGLKAEVLQNLLLQVAYFDIERATAYENDTTNILSLNGLARYRGLEFTATGELSQNWSIAASALLMDAEQLNRDNSATYGKVPENTPEKTASLFAEYKVPMLPGLALSGGMFYVGERAVNDNNDDFIGGYTTYTAGARYLTKVGGEKTTFQLVVDNLTDKNYWSTAGNGFIGVGASRTLKASVKIDF